MDIVPLEEDPAVKRDLHVEATYRLTEALVESESRMRRRVELLSEVVFETDPAGCFVFLNDAWATVIGRDADESLGSTLRSYVLSEDWPACLRALTENAPADAKPPPPIRMRRENGAVIWVEMSVAPIASGGAVGVLHDVTEQKLARDQLRQLSMVARYTQNLVLITDAQGHVEWANRAFTERSGYRLDELVGRKPGDLLQGPGTDPAMAARVGELLREQLPFEAELLNYTRDGEPYWVQIHITPIFDADGRLAKYVSIQTDSTELRRTQDELEVATAKAESANEAKTQFLATISHEMRTPLNAILGSIELALDDEADPAARHDHLLRINDGAALLKRLITDILDVSKIEAGQIDIQMAPVDIRACLESATAPVAELAQAKGVAFELVCDDALPASLLGDGERLRQIVANLAENAVKFTDRGHVRVEAHRIPPSTAGGAQLEIRVLDSGVGIAEAEQERIFERFVQVDGSTTRSVGGTGLGLSIVRSIAEALGGTVTVESRPGEGTAFRATLPLVPVPERREQTPGAARRVLVAEDNDVNFAMFEAYLLKGGYTVDRAVNGREAVDAAQLNDLVLMDVEMPEMDGLEATRRIRESERGVGAPPMPVLAVTAHALQEYRDRCLEAGCTGYLSKPVGMRELLDAVAAALDAVPSA